MKKIYLVLCALIAALALAGCGRVARDKTVKIAVMGNSGMFRPGYADGIKKAAEDFNSEHSGSGYSVDCEFYEDNGSYEEGAAIIGSLAEDKSVTAVIGSPDMDINKTAAHVYGGAGKLFAVPYHLYDSVYEDDNSGMIFSLCNSAKTVGETLRAAAAETAAKRWVVCAASDGFSEAEMNGFICGDSDDGIKIVDCADISTVGYRFDEIYKRWQTLGAEGVMIFPGRENGFELLKKLRERGPELICGGDTAFDNSGFLIENPDVMRIMPGFIMADEFTVDPDEENVDKLKNMIDKYTAETGQDFDTWFIQGYNTVRMIADTAVEAQTANSALIADFLHKNGYRGFCQSFEFDENGLKINGKYCYNVYIENGHADTFEISD